jgi:hypothetical protein
MRIALIKVILGELLGDERKEDRQCTSNIILTRVHETNCCCEKAISITYWSVCACAYVHRALKIQHATLMRHIMTSFVAPGSLPHFSTLSHKRCDFRKNVIEDKMCVFIFSTIFV